MDKNPDAPSQRPPTPENERVLVIQHDPAKWNGHRSVSSRGQLMRDFIELGFPYERAKDLVEVEFAARTPFVRPPGGGGVSQGSVADPSSVSRGLIPAPSIVSSSHSPAPHSASDTFGRNPHNRSPSPDFDPRPPPSEMTLDMLRQELRDEGISEPYIEKFITKSRLFKYRPTSSRHRVECPPPGSIPPGLVWAKNPVKERDSMKSLFLWLGSPLEAVRGYCEEQFGPETRADRDQSARTATAPSRYNNSSEYRKCQGMFNELKSLLLQNCLDLVQQREEWRQVILGLGSGPMSENAVRFILDDIFGPETEANRAARNPGPDWMRIWDVCNAAAK
ncbi:hypothetical protein ONS95_014200 [Cadophora gregata]|uniref:uncharacterized protein n=1 Tax=Cadophora gregata TaxID=51156 RepID=UPI0026DCC346|nr:uncharacterized protein ONS95_014200 [Cadophora gregata]KAK0114716.1 hypothetical protein ONS95_014200 [Cadophora gregata]